MGSFKRIVGVDVDLTLIGGVAADGVALAGLAEHTAFRLTRVAGAGGRMLRARFLLKAPGGSMGDLQLFDLLRRLGAAYRWANVVKLLSGEDGNVAEFSDSDISTSPSSTVAKPAPIAWPGRYTEP